jgi:hypothetical protein
MEHEKSCETIFFTFLKFINDISGSLIIELAGKGMGDLSVLSSPRKPNNILISYTSMLLYLKEKLVSLDSCFHI